MVTRSLSVVTRGPRLSGTCRDSFTAAVTLSPMSCTISLTASMMVLTVSDIVEEEGVVVVVVAVY